MIGGQKFTALDPGMTEDEFTLIHPWFFPECVARVPVSLWGSGG